MKGDGFKRIKKARAAKELNVPGAMGKYPMIPIVAICFKTTIYPISLFLNYLIRGAYLCRAFKGCLYRTVFVHREINRLFYSIFRNISSFYNKRYVYISEFFWVILCFLSFDINLKTGHILLLLFHNRDDIHSCTAAYT